MSSIWSVDNDSRIFDLHSVNVDNFASTAKGIGAAFRDTNILDLALFLELLQALHGLLDRSLAIKAMNVVKIDIWQPKTLERFLNRCTSIFWCAVDYTGTVGLAFVRKLGCEEDIITFVGIALEPLA